MVDQLKRLYEASPFQPFEIEMDDGKVLPVDLPEHVGWSAEAGVIMCADVESVRTFPLSRIKTIRMVEKPRVRWAQ